MKIPQSNIEKRIPLQAWDNDMLVSKFADITIPYEILLPEIYSSGEQDFDKFHETWTRALRALPENTIVHKQDWFIENQFIPTAQKGKTFLSLASDKHFTGRRYLQHRAFVYITLCPKRNMRTSSATSALCRGNIVPADMLSEEIISNFTDAAAQFMHILSENGITSTRLDKDTMIGTNDSFGIIEQYLSLEFKQKSFLSDIITTDKDFLVGDKYVSCFSVSELNNLPSFVATCKKNSKLSSDTKPFYVGYPSSLCLTMGFSHIYNQYFFLDRESEVISKVEQQGKHQLSLSKVSRENAINKEFNDKYLNEHIVSARRPVRCAFNVITWDTSFPNLLKKNTLIGSRLAGMDCTCNKTERIVPQIFWGGIPGSASQYPEDMTFLTFLEQGACFINNETNYHSSQSGFGIRLCDRIFGIPLNVDISDEPRTKGWTDNRNKFILGPSGSGKSFFTNHMVRQYYEQGTHVVIVDVGDSYLGLCKQIQQETKGEDGIYYTYTEQKPISFNPFYVRDKIYTVEKKEQLASLIFCLWKNEHEIITKVEETHISTAIGMYTDGICSGEYIPSFDTFYEFLSSSFHNHITSQGVRRENFDIDNLLQVLRPYAKGGMYDYLLNASKNIDLLNKRFIVFEIDNIKDHKTLFPVVTLILMDTFISKMRHPDIASQRKVILIEEAWKAISKAGTAEFIKYLYKTVRKHFGEAIVVTQEVDDIINNPIVKESIISNADCKILLDQRKYANKFAIVQDTLALSDKESAIALSVNKDIQTKNRSPYKEVFITLNGNHSAVYAVEVSPEEYLTYTTEKTEKVKLFELEKKTGSMQKAIQLYLKSK